MANLPLLCVAVLLGAVIANNELDLWIAAKRGNLADVDNALGKGADPDVQHGDTTPIYWASMHGWIDVVNTLISHHADINIPSKYGWTPLMMATLQGHMNVVEALINAHANINISDSTGDTALHRAATWNKQSIASLLLRNGADPIKQDNKGRTPSDVARAYGHHQLANIIDTFTATSTGPIVLLNTATSTPDYERDLPLHTKIIIGCVVTVSTAMILYLVIWFYKAHRRGSLAAFGTQPGSLHFMNSDNESIIHSQKL